jgi:hypothetical protein
MAAASNESGSDGSRHLKLRFSLRAVNSLGLRAVSPYQEVSLLLNPPNLTGARLDPPTYPNQTCAMREMMAAHPMGWPLSVSWPQRDTVASYRLCSMPASGLPGCVVGAGDASTLKLPPLPVGDAVVTLEARSLGGLNSSVSFNVVVDDTPPVPGAVRMGLNTSSPDFEGGYDGLNSSSSSFLGSPDFVTCTWEEAVDDESGILKYDVELVEASAGCGQLEPNRLRVGSLHAEETSCSARFFTFSVPESLDHGKAYRCVLTVTNAAGLSAVTYSPDFVVDMSAMKLESMLGDVHVLDRNGVNQTYIGDKVFTVSFVADVEDTAAVAKTVDEEDCFYTTQGTRACPTVIDYLPLQ